MNYLVLLIFLAGLGIFLLATIFFPPRLASEILLSPHWTLREPVFPQIVDRDEQDWVPLILDEELLFVRYDGVVSLREKQDFHLSHNRNSYINTSRNHSVLVLKDHYGEILRSFENPSFPLLFDSAIAAVSQDGLGLEIWNSEGTVLFSRRWASLISAVDLLTIDGYLFTAVGLLDGRVYLFSGAEELFPIEPEGSDIPILYDLALHASDRRGEVHLFTVEGFNPAMLKKQTFAVSPEGQLTMANVSSVFLPSQPIRPPRMEVLDNDGSNLLVLLEDQSRAIGFDQELSDDPLVIDGLGDFKHAWRHNNFSIYCFSDPTQSEITIRSGNNAILFSSQRPFPVAAEIAGNIIYVRNSHLLSAYLLEEG